MRLVAFVFLFAACCAAAQDYEREQRWAAEVEPNLVVGDAVRLKLASGREFLGIHAAGKPGQRAVLLVHGVGVHPDHGIIGVLRVALQDLGYATLSIQMPVLRADAANDEYAALFPEAGMRIQAGADWLAQKGYAGEQRPVLLSHSMGSRMSNAYLERALDAPFSGWVCLGLSGVFGRIGGFKAPVLDVLGENDLPGVLNGSWRRKLTLDGMPGSGQVRIAGAGHFYTGQEKALVAELNRFLVPLK